MSSKTHPRFTMEIFPEGSKVIHNVFKLNRRQVVTVEILNNRNEVLTKGASICNTTDKFNLEIGKSVAIGRAAKHWWYKENQSNA
jgi:hypothetical protein